MNRVLLTGARGFLGRHTIPELLARGFDVHTVTSNAQAAAFETVTWHIADLLDPEPVEELVSNVCPTHLLHLAWFTKPGEYWQAQENLAWVQASIDLLRAFARHGGRRAVLVGSCAEYDWRFGYCQEELTPCEARSAYAASKLALHQIMGAFTQSVGIGVAWARLFFLFGPYERTERLVPCVVRSLLAGNTAACSDGNQIRDFLYVKDAAAALAALLEHDFCGPVNIASGRPMAVRDLVMRIAQKLNAVNLVELGARPRLESDPPVLLADVGRLTNIVGWSPRYDLDAALDETIAWWRQCPY